MAVILSPLTQIDTDFMLLYSVIAIVVFTALNIALFSISSKRKI